MSDLYAGLDVSLEKTSVCVVDAEGRIMMEKTAPSDPSCIADLLGPVTGSFKTVGLEAGPLSQWLYFGLKDARFPAICIETRHAKAAITAKSINKNDRNDARSIAHLVRSGWHKRGHVKSIESQELRSLLVAREFFVNKLRDHENEIRGLLRPFGLKVGRVGAAGFEARVRELTEGRARLELIVDTLLRGRASMMDELAILHRELLRVTRNDEVCRRFMTIPGVGPVTG